MVYYKQVKNRKNIYSLYHKGINPLFLDELLEIEMTDSQSHWNLGEGHEQTVYRGKHTSDP